MKRRLLCGLLVLFIFLSAFSLTVMADDHDLYFVEAVEPTCKTDGSIAYYACSHCGSLFYDGAGLEEIEDSSLIILPGGHVEQHDGYVLPTCTEAGYSGDIVCTRCNLIFSSGQVLPANCAATHFQDLNINEWYHESVDFAVNAGLMNGINPAYFDPLGNMSRAMIVSVLYRMEELPAISAESPFSDVALGQWYTEAVLWAAETGLVEGYGNGRFGPDDAITREQLVTILYRYARHKGLDTEADLELDHFPDSNAIHNYALTAFSWAVNSGLMKGSTDGRLHPESYSERCQLAAVLQRFYAVAGNALSLPYIASSAQNIRVYLEGQPISCTMVRGMLLITAEDFATATGLTLESRSPLLLTGTDRVELEGPSLTVNGVTTTALEALSLDGTLWLPLFALSRALNYPIYVDPVDDLTYITPSARPFHIPEDINVPVLMYHAVSDNCWGIEELFVSPSEMEKQLAYLVENGYDPIWFSDLAHVEDYDKPVILTFDDGYDDNYTQLFPLLQKYNVKANFFIIARSPGNLHKMTKAQLLEVADSGLVSVQSHGYSHELMDKMNEATLRFEMEESKYALTRITKRIPYVVCYPEGRYSNLTISVAQDYYLFGLRVAGSLYNTSDDPHMVSRYYIARSTDLSTFAYYLRNAGT